LDDPVTVASALHSQLASTLAPVILAKVLGVRVADSVPPVDKESPSDIGPGPKTLAPYEVENPSLPETPPKKSAVALPPAEAVPSLSTLTLQFPLALQLKDPTNN
jgi:hypothetical protein